MDETRCWSEDARRSARTETMDEAIRPGAALDATGYLAAPGFESQLLDELRDVIEVRERLILARGPTQAAYWAQNVWLRPLRIEIESIKDGARRLRAIQRNWALYSVAQHRRASLIRSELPWVSAKPLEFPAKAPSAPLGSFTLLDERTILASGACTSPFPNGEASFVEHKIGPPTRAYLKLWEAFALLGTWPASGERCLDAGCSPGGWTWALAQLGARVLSVDRAQLAPDVAEMPGVEYREGSAFSLQPQGEEPFDWIFSDVICYPERLLEWVRRWLASGKCRNFICTLKFQGRDHYGVIPEFAAIPGSRVLHLSSNKHELTWIRTDPRGKDDPASRDADLAKDRPSIELPSTTTALESPEART
jgi:23S rRNA (cytidine2498-2'-O)-methyltransferase